MIDAAHIFEHRRHNRHAEDSELSAVSMARQCQLDAMRRRSVEKVRMMGKQYLHCVSRHARHRRFHRRRTVQLEKSAQARIIDAEEPKRARAVHHQRACIPQHMYARFRQCLLQIHLNLIIIIKKKNQMRKIIIIKLRTNFN